jgi:hypothetical protein
VLDLRIDDEAANSLAARQVWWTSRESADGSRGPRPHTILIDSRRLHADRLPYLAGQFDFSIAIGVVEHLVEPAKFLAELVRVSHAGYIECPRPVAQIVAPDPTIRWVADYECETLFIRESSPADAAIMEPLRRKMNGRASIAASLSRARASARLRPLVIVELAWTGRFKYRIVHSGGASPQPSVGDPHHAGPAVRSARVPPPFS